MKLLTAEDLEELTGAKQPARQRQILEKHGIFYIQRIDGTITTTWEHVNNPHAGQLSPEAEPDFGKIA